MSPYQLSLTKLAQKIHDKKVLTQSKFPYVYLLLTCFSRLIGHGWQASKDLGAIFYARGPSFKRGYKTKQALQAIDVYPLLCHLLGIKSLPNNGSMENMKEILQISTSASARCALSTVVAYAVPFVMFFAIV